MTTSRSTPPVIWRLVEESLSEAAFLWLRLDGALDAEDHQLLDVERWVEGRLFGALDGVRVAGPRVLDGLLPEAIRDVDLGAVAAAAYVTANLKDVAATRLVEDVLHESPAERWAALACGLGRAGQTELLHALGSRLGPAHALGQTILLEALTFCGEAPRTSLQAWLESPEAELRCAAARALRFLPSSERDKLISRALASPDPQVQTHACIASAAAGDPQAWSACTARAARLDLHSAPLLPLLAACGGSREHACVGEALSVPELRRHALSALGFAGTRAAAEAALEQIKAGRDVQEALAALAMITGLKPREFLLASAAPAAAELEAPAAIPDVAALEAWWASRGQGFEAGARYLEGEVASLLQLRTALERGPTGRRHTLALEMAVRSRGACFLQPRAFCQLQRQQLGQLAQLPERQIHEASSVLGLQPLGST